MEENLNQQPVPELFCKSDTKKPFETCLMCQCALANTTYLVEKAIRNYHPLKTQEVLFEYAMCLTCAGKMRMELSEESRTKIEAYLLEKTNVEARKKHLAHPDRKLENWISSCIIKDSPVDQSAEFSIYALCNGNEIVYGDLPYAISGEAQDEMTELLSAKTLEIMDDFIGNHFSGPPEVKEILKRRPVLI